MTSLGDITVGFRADTSSLAAGFNFLRQGLGGVPGLAVVAGAAVVGIGAKAAQMAGDFQASMTQLVTGAGESRSALKTVADGILAMAPQVGTSTKDLADAMFLIESAGYRGSQGLQVLRIAAEGAKVGNVNLSQITDVLTTSLHDYHLSVSQAVPVTNSLIQTVKDGKMYMDQLNQSLTNVLPVSNALQVKLSDVEGALATMAASGDKGAAAGTHLSMMLKMLANPASSATKEMTAMGINSINLAKEMRVSLPGALQMIQDAVAKHFTPGSVEYNRAISAILGGSKSGIAGLELMGGSLKTFASNTKDIAGTMKTAGSSVQGWADIQQTFNFKMAQAKEVVETFMIRLGTALLPVLTKLATFFVSNVVPALQLFGGWIQQNVLPILEKFGQWFQANAMPALQQFAAIIQQNVVPVIQNLVTIIGFALGWIRDHWAQIWGFVGPYLQGVWTFVTGIIKAAWSLISGIFKVALDLIHGNWTGVWNDIKDTLLNVFAGIGQAVRGFVEMIGSAFSGLGTLLHGIWDGIVGVIKGAIDLIIGLINGFIGGIDSIGIDIGPVHIHPNIPKIPYLASGGIVGPGQSFIAGEAGPELIAAGTSGASVIPLGAGGGGTHTTEIYLDGLKIAQVVAPHMDALVRAKFGPRSRL